MFEIGYLLDKSLYTTFVASNLVTTSKIQKFPLHSPSQETLEYSRSHYYDLVTKLQVIIYRFPERSNSRMFQFQEVLKFAIRAETNIVILLVAHDIRYQGLFWFQWKSLFLWYQFHRLKYTRSNQSGVKIISLQQSAKLRALVHPRTHAHYPSLIRASPILNTRLRAFTLINKCLTRLFLSYVSIIGSHK